MHPNYYPPMYPSMTASSVESQSSSHLAIARRDQLLADIAKEKRRSRWCSRFLQVVQLVLLIQAISGVVTGVLHYAQDEAGCTYPIPLWLLVNGSISILLNISMFMFMCCKHITNPAEIHKQATQGFLIVGIVSIIALIIWCLIGAKWAFTSHSDDCDSTSLRSIQTNVGLLLLMLAFNLVLSPVFYLCYKKHQQVQLDRDEILKQGEQAEIQVRTSSITVVTM